MRRFFMVLLITVIATLLPSCMATRKFVRTEVKTSSDNLSTTLNGRIDKTDSNVSEVRDGVARVDTRVTGVDSRVTQLDAKTDQQITAVKGDVGRVDSKAAQAQTSADRVGRDVQVLDDKFINRNQFTVAAEKQILFKFDSAKIDNKYQSEIESIADMVSKNADAVVILEGRTDSRGDSDYNVKLGERRVESVKRSLAVDMGVPIYRIHEISFGSAKPIAENDSKEGREKNRAVVLSVLLPKASGSTASRNPNQ
jgi:outer membrane protein OmpA-like peptidoglycan-associated protein